MRVSRLNDTVGIGLLACVFSGLAWGTGHWPYDDPNCCWPVLAMLACIACAYNAHKAVRGIV